MTANNAFERTVKHGGPRLAAAQRWWPAAQLGRQTALNDVTTLVDIPAAPLRSALEEGGWRVESLKDLNIWWCRECWHLRSTWSPQSSEAFLTFVHEPQDDSRNPKIMAVKASAVPPVQWQSSPQEHTLYFGRGWRKQIGELMGYLNGLRNQSAV